MLQPELLQPVTSGCAPVAIGVNDQLGAAPKNAVRSRVHVTDDHSRFEPCFEQSIGAAVDADEHGLQIPDIRTDRSKVSPVIGPADNDQDVAVAEVGLQVGQLQRPCQ